MKFLVKSSIFIIALIFPFLIKAQVIVTAPTTLKTGSGGSCAPAALGDIIIKEQKEDDFTENASAVGYIITLPAGFEFGNTDATSITITYSKVGTTTGTSAYTAGTKTINSTGGRRNQFIFYYTNATTSDDTAQFTISGITITCYTPGASGTIMRTGGSAVQNGNTANAQSHGFLDSRIASITTNLYEYSYKYYEYPNGQQSYIQYGYKNGGMQTLTPSSSRGDYCHVNTYMYFNVPAVAGASFSLWANGTQISTSSYTSGGMQRLSYTTKATETGNRDYYVQYTLNNCTYQSEKILLNLNKIPKEYNFNTTKDTSFQQADDPVALNDYVTRPAGENSTLEAIAGWGINAINSNTTFLFLPGIVKSGSLYPQYVVRDDDNTCQAVYQFKKPLIVSDPLAALPDYLNSSKMPPFCANGSKFTVQFKTPASLPSDSILVYYYLSKKTGTVSGSNYTSGITSPVITIDPIKDNFGNNLLYYYVVFKNTTTGSTRGYPGYITLFPERNPALVGLPAPKTPGSDIVELCSSSKDTIFMRPNPSNGLLEISIFNTTTNTYDPFAASLKYFKLIAGETSTNRFFIPQELFQSDDAADSNYNVTFKIRYIYPGTQYGQCPDTTIRIIKFGIPIDITNSIVSPLSKPFCFGDSIKAHISYGSSITYDPLDRFYWNYGDGLSAESDSLLDMKHLYKTPGKYYLRFKTLVKTLPAGYCNNDQLDTIRIGAKPIADFDVAQNFLDEDANFKSLAVINISNPSDKKDTISIWSWDLGTSSAVSYVNDTDKIYEYTYPASAIQRDPFRIIHKVTSGWGCVDSVIKYTPVFKVISPDITTSYNDNFDDLTAANSWYASGWYQRDTLKSSWLNSAADGTTILHNTPKHPVSPSWNTMLYSIDNSSKKDNSYIARYVNEEISWVESPVFELENLTLPMVSFDSWVNADNSFDGVCLQYAICDSVPFGKEKWNIVGEYSKGVNWYNSFTVISRPSGSLDGWSGTDIKDWSFSAFDLDAVLAELQSENKKRVRFRMLFTSNKDNFPNRNLDGFAFDNFFIGQRNRMVVIEEFCDYQKHDVEDVVGSAPSIFNDNQTIKIQYHTSLFRNDDDINNQNPDEPSARALHYGLGKDLPRGIIDGIMYDNTKKLSEWGPGKFIERSLSVSPFTISVTAVPDNDSLKISANIVKVATALEAKNYLVHLAVVEKEVPGNGKTFTNVLRNLVPNAAGTRIDKSTTWNTTTVTRAWKPFVAPVSDFKVIAFIQDEDTKEIYQGNQIEVLKGTVESISNFKSGNTQKTEISFNEIYISPNPVTEDLRVVFNGILSDNYRWTIIDAYGQVIQRGTINAGANASFIPAQNLTSGLYYLQLEGESRVYVEKFAVVK